ncbi:Flagellar motor switch protein FliM [Maioricimonas rarisocia]|uniref:Flagellar motor switch protein FliM n=1 Tax=Maioricimonas rarisocia TaxID=2528026 RepID=A0A517ZCR8_9PLAN|nr:FliM/FliN family flagellar motor switch protein [Maioricimonas rarisocia]QDU40230.1 Flagellar motor switch protein FliM [Maioricimonas rarisocia]
MTDPPRLSRLDFHDPRRLPELIWQALTNWQTESLTLVQEYWTSILAHPASLKWVSSEPMFCGAALRALPDPGLGVEIRIGRTPVATLLSLSRRQVLGLVADMLDMDGEEWPEDRELTSVEMSMVELALQRLADGLSDAWPGPRPIVTRLGPTIDRPRRSRLFNADETLVVTRLSIESRFGTEECIWLLPQREFGELIEDEGAVVADVVDRAPNPNMMALAERIPVEVVVELGRAELTMTQVANLKEGDILVLDQPISRSLTAFIGDQTKWTGVPRRVGSRQGFEIETTVDQ